MLLQDGVLVLLGFLQVLGRFGLGSRLRRLGFLVVKWQLLANLHLVGLVAGNAREHRRLYVRLEVLTVGVVEIASYAVLPRSGSGGIGLGVGVLLLQRLQRCGGKHRLKRLGPGAPHVLLFERELRRRLHLVILHRRLVVIVSFRQQFLRTSR